MAFLASGSDPTVMHCCKIANGKEKGVSRFLHRSPTWFLVLSHTGGVHHIAIRVQCLDKRAYFCRLLHRLEGDWIHCSAV